ncbi:MAG: methyltransferase domain-containing protein, partial [Actinomycetota bacterium]|nr:methyltransferase domain-containing protein [Actinomycetota bacterium]
MPAEPTDGPAEPTAGHGEPTAGHGERARYEFSYSEDSPYGHAVRLLAAHTHVPGGLVLDVGCGFGAVAEPVRDLGLAYVGLDVERAGLEDLASRGFEHAVVELGDPGALLGRLEEVVAGRPLAALVALDVVEHLVDGAGVLASLHSLALAHGRPPLVVSIPNVTHLDLAAKLLVGRWDVTSTGLLDETHVALYSLDRLARTFAATGWEEVGAEDFPLDASDQHFPPEAAPLAATPLHDFLAELRERAAPGARTNQWVRAYSPVAVVPGARAVLGPADLDAPGPFLSVVLAVRDAPAPELHDALVALDAQSVTGFELLLVARSASPADLDAATAALAPFSGGLAPFSGGLASRSRVVPGPA